MPTAQSAYFMDRVLQMRYLEEYSENGYVVVQW